MLKWTELTLTELWGLVETYNKQEKFKEEAVHSRMSKAMKVATWTAPGAVASTIGSNKKSYYQKLCFPDSTYLAAFSKSGARAGVGFSWLGEFPGLDAFPGSF